MKFHYFLRDTQTKPEMGFIFMGRIHTVEALEDSRFLIVRNTGAVIGDGHAKTGGVFQRKADASSPLRITERIVD